MGLKQDIDQLYTGALRTVYRRDQPAAAVSAYNIATYSLFTIEGGPVYLAYLIGRPVGGALASGATFHIHVCGVNADTGAANANSVQNAIMQMPLDVGKAPSFNALAVGVVTLAVASNGMVASVGLIQLIVAGAATTVGIGVEWMLAYRKIHPVSNVYPS
jgi:hypothetical protein